MTRRSCPGAGSAARLDAWALPPKHEAMEFWNDYYRGDRFRNELRSLPDLFPCAVECPHTGVPVGLRVLLDDDAVTRGRVQAVLPPELRCAWFGLCLMSMTLHSRFRQHAGAWARRIFCPIPVANVGLGCVHGTLPLWMVEQTGLAAVPEADFPRFFAETILPEAAEVTSIPAEAIAAKLLGEKAFRQSHIPRLVAGIMSVLSAKFPGEGQV